MTPRHEIVVNLTLDTTEIVDMLRRVADALDLTVPEDAEHGDLCRCTDCTPSESQPVKASSLCGLCGVDHGFGAA